MEKLKDGFLRNSLLIRREEGEIEANRFLRDSEELAKFINKILDKYHDQTSVYYTGGKYKYFRRFKRVNSSEHGRVGNEFNNFHEFEGENCYMSSGNACFFKWFIKILKKVFTKDCLAFVQSLKKRFNVMTTCRIPEFCQRYRLYIGVNDVKSERILPIYVNQRETCLCIHEINFAFL